MPAPAVYPHAPAWRGRLAPALGVAAIHGLIGYALLAGFGASVAGDPPAALKTFDIAAPPPPEETPAPAAAPEPEGASASANLRAAATSVVAPPPRVAIDTPPPIVAAPAAGQGSDATAGASDRPGPGTGAGGEGSGTGSGGSGAGTGGGGGTPPRLIDGRIVNRDYPRAAGNAEGTVVVAFTVGTDGRARGCAVRTSSGNAALDGATCRLIEARFRYAPARDARGRAVERVTGWRQRWWIEGR